MVLAKNRCASSVLGPMYLACDRIWSVSEGYRLQITDYRRREIITCYWLAVWLHSRKAKEEKVWLLVVTLRLICGLPLQIGPCLMML